VNCSSVTTQDVTIRAAGYFGIVDLNGEGGNTYRRVQIVSPYNDRPLAANADGIHSSNCKKGPLIEECKIANINDDFFNVHNTLQLVANRESDTSLLLVDPHLFAGPGDSIYGTFETLSHVSPGHSFSFYALNALKSTNALARGIVKSIKVVDDTSLQYLIKQTYDKANAVANSCPLDACGSGLMSWSSARLYNVTFSSALPATIVQATFASSDTWANSGAIIRNNTFTATSCNLGRMKSIAGTIRDNNFSFACSQNLEVGPLQRYIEGPLGITGVSIVHNTIVASGSSPIHTFESDVLIANNTIVP